MNARRDNSIKNNSHKDKSFNQKNIASDRIKKLFVEAESSFKEYPNLSKRYVVLARKLSTRYKVRLTTEQKRLFCKNCSAYLKSGVNSRTRLEHGKLVRTCLECKAVRRTIYKK
jgi:ribonuclease P protein subunit RPR2